MRTPRRLLVSSVLWLALLFTGALFLLLPMARPIIPSAQAAVAQAAQADADLLITKTVGLAAGECATTSSVVVHKGDTVYFCLTVANQGQVSVTLQTMVDPLLDPSPIKVAQTLAPGAKLVLTPDPYPFRKANVTTDLTNTITLTATQGVTPDVIVKQAQAFVKVAQPAVTIKKSVGVTANACATTTSLVVAPNARVYYCLTIQNTGNVPLMHHTLVDPLLNLNTIFEQTLQPAAALVLTSTQQSAFSTVATGSPLVNTFFYTGTDAAGVTTAAQTTATVTLGQPGITVVNTASTNATTCGSNSTLTVLYGATVYYCFTIKNSGALPLTQFKIRNTAFGLDNVIEKTLQPTEQFSVMDSELTQLISGVTARLLVANVQTPISNTVVVTATTTEGLQTVQAASAQVSAGAATIGLHKYLSTDPSSCPTTDLLTVSNNSQLIYYCLVIENRGDVTLTNHTLSEAGVTASFNYTLAPSAVLTLTKTALDAILNTNTNILGPRTFSGSATNVITLVSSNAENYQTTANASASVLVPQTPATATPSPTRTFTPLPGPTSTPTPITPTPTTPPSSTPTGTTTPVIASLLPTPSATPDFLVTGITTPLPGAVPQGVSPLATPPNPNSPLPVPLNNGVDVGATALAAQAATATALALFTPPVPSSPLTTPLAPGETPTATPLSIASPLLPAATARPIQLPTPLPTPNFMGTFIQVANVAVTAAGWIWFLCGSLIFFITAGILAGLGFRRQERRRYALTDTPVEAYQTVAPPPVGNPLFTPSNQPRAAADDDEHWPASLP